MLVFSSSDVICDIYGSREESYPLVSMTASEKPLITHTADDKPSSKSGDPDVVPPRPAPPSKPVPSQRLPSSVCIT